MRATVVGLGYVGLVTAACLADWGHDVVGVDGDERRLEDLKAGRMPLHEPGLEDLVAAGVKADRLHFTSPSASAIADARIVFVAVGTHDGNGGWQTATIRGALAAIVPHMADDATLAVRSTLPPDFIRQLPWLVNAIRQDSGLRPIPVMTNPEFTREGTAVRDFLGPDRVVIGIADDPHGRGESALRKVYERAGAPILAMGAIDAALDQAGRQPLPGDQDQLRQRTRTAVRCLWCGHRARWSERCRTMPGSVAASSGPGSASVVHASHTR